MSFGQSVALNSARLLATVNTKCYAIAKELFYRVVELTPSPANPGRWAEGYLANQWYPAEGDFSGDLDMATSRSGANSINRIRAMNGQVFYQGDGILTMANNLPYAYRAEAIGWPKEEGYNGGQRREVSGGYQNTGAPYRMVALSLQQIAAKYS